jgi:hypothetical protein
MIPAKTRKLLAGAAATAGVILAVGVAYAQQGPRGNLRYPSGRHRYSALARPRRAAQLTAEKSKSGPGSTIPTRLAV